MKKYRLAYVFLRMPVSNCLARIGIAVLATLPSRKAEADKAEKKVYLLGFDEKRLISENSLRYLVNVGTALEVPEDKRIMLSEEDFVCMNDEGELFVLRNGQQTEGSKLFLNLRLRMME